MNPIDYTALVKLTRDLVRVPSEPCQEGEVAHLLQEVLPDFGFSQASVDDYGSVTGVIQGDLPGPTLLMDAHIDTVGLAPGVEWTQDPYSGELVGERIYGRGTSDMKGALAAMIVAARAVDKRKLSGKFVLSASVMEEVLEGAALERIMAIYQPDYVIIGEASNLKIVHGGRGRAEIKIQTIGRPAHSSSPESGVNAVEAILPVITAIQSLKLPRHEFTGPAIVALTDIISEPYPGHSVLPSRCQATFDRRLVPGETLESVLEPLRKIRTISGARVEIELSKGEYRTYTGRQIIQEKWYPAWILDKEHRLVQAAAASLVSAGIPVEYSAYNFCTNAAYSAGVAGVPTIGFGPSWEQLAHITDEYVEVEHLVKAAKVYKNLIEAILAA